MDIAIEARGDVVERQELLNGTRSLTIQGASDDGRWRIEGTLFWNLGLMEYAGEGDITLTSEIGELFASANAVQADESDAGDGALQVRAHYAIDGGSGEFDEATGVCRGEIRLAADSFEGRWIIGAE
jgi:hypothetical protein